MVVCPSLDRVIWATLAFGARFSLIWFLCQRSLVGVHRVRFGFLVLPGELNHFWFNETGENFLVASSMGSTSRFQGAVARETAGTTPAVHCMGEGA